MVIESRWLQPAIDLKLGDRAEAEADADGRDPPQIAFSPDTGYS